MNKRSITKLIVISLIAFFAVVGFMNVVQPSLISYTIDQDQRGVVYSHLFDEVDKENIIAPGAGLKFPWNDVYIYEMFEQSADEQMDVLDKDGNVLQLQMTVRFTPIPDKLGYLHETFGQDFEDVMVTPEVRSATRQVMQRYSAEEIYAIKSAEIEQLIKDDLTVLLEQNYVRLTAMLIRSIELPDSVRIALEEKYRLKYQQEHNGG